MQVEVNKPAITIEDINPIDYIIAMKVGGEISVLTRMGYKGDSYVFQIFEASSLNSGNGYTGGSEYGTDWRSLVRDVATSRRTIHAFETSEQFYRWALDQVK